MTDMTGKRALVTGAASGVGKAVVETLAQGDAQVWALDIVPELDIPGTTYLRTDVSDVDAWAQVAATVGEAGLDYLHLNAGIQIAPPSAPLAEYRFEAMQLERYRRMMGVNVDGVVFGLQALLDHMRPGGAIVVTASLAGVTPYDVDPLYSMSKHAVVGLVRSLAGVCAARQLTINAICPGGVDTGIIPEEQRRPEAVFMTPQDIADEVMMLFNTDVNGKTWAKVAAAKPAWVVRAPGDKERQ
ncbi:MAG: SDR family oxidoreductase [Pseudomonadota bacterium]